VKNRVVQKKHRKGKKNKGPRVKCTKPISHREGMIGERAEVDDCGSIQLSREIATKWKQENQ